MFKKKSDMVFVVILLVFCVVAAVVFNKYFKYLPVRAEIYYQGVLTETVELAEGEDRMFSVGEAPQVIFRQHPDGKISFEESNCSDQKCVKKGKIGFPGRSIECEENELFVKIYRSSFSSRNAETEIY